MDEARSWDLERVSTVCGCMVEASVAEFSRVLVAERKREMRFLCLFKRF